MLWPMPNYSVSRNLTNKSTTTKPYLIGWVDNQNGSIDAIRLNHKLIFYVKVFYSSFSQFSFPSSVFNLTIFNYTKIHYLKVWWLLLSVYICVYMCTLLILLILLKDHGWRKKKALAASFICVSDTRQISKTMLWIYPIFGPNKGFLIG